MEEDYDGDEDLTAKLNELRDMMGNIYVPQNQYSTIDIILAKDEIEVEDLLEQDEFLQDLRRSKTSLMTYLAKPEVLTKLIHFISNEDHQDSTDTAEHDRAKRFAHLAYEAIQTEAMKEVVINNSDLLDKFFAFLDIPTEMDPLRCAYFSRIVELLFERYPKELVSYLRKRNCIVAKFVWHINNQYIVESLFRLIDSQVSHQWLHDEDLIPLLMYKMAETKDPELQERTAATFVEILDLFVPFPYSILTTQMFYSEIVAQQWEHFTLSEPKNYDKIKNGLNVAVGILNLSFDGNLSATEETPIFMSTVIKNLDFFLRLLEVSQTPDRVFKMTYGDLQPPFGFLRVKILEFLNALLNTRYLAIVESFWKTDIFSILLDLMFHYKWNNTLHFYVDQILCNAMNYDTSGGKRIYSELVEKCKLVDRMVEVFEKEYANGGKGGSVGYMGQLTRIANELNKIAAVAENVEFLGRKLEAREDWSKFVTGRLAQVNERNNTPIAGGVAPFPQGGAPADSMSGYSFGGMGGVSGLEGM
eukprot:TRINITY_DN14954_c0_g1_i1.p1 TRINITY_DN14954_c0_g1~~TRINITY_DN14954_c0_g1_i1.p1  ORF type:complete len:588 (-),score=120.31 TRINITY_DN14954_c0_g1_i1:32-1621(-)